MLLSEAHSAADVLNEIFVLAALPSSRTPGTPFGYGKERFFWSMLAAVGILVMGGCFPSTRACTRCSRPVPAKSFL